MASSPVQLYCLRFISKGLDDAWWDLTLEEAKTSIKTAVEEEGADWRDLAPMLCTLNEDAPVAKILRDLLCGNINSGEELEPYFTCSEVPELDSLLAEVGKPYDD